MTTRFEFLSTHSPDECARRLAAALFPEEVQPVKLPDGRARECFSGTVEGRAFDLSYRSGAIDEPPVRLWGTLEPAGQETKVAGEIDDASSRQFRLIVRAFLIVWGALPWLLLAIVAVFGGTIESPVATGVVAVAAPAIAIVLYRFSQRALTRSQAAPLAHLHELLR